MKRAPLLLLCLVTLASPAGITAQADPIRISGSDSIGAKLMPLLCEAYRAKVPEADFNLSAEGSTSGANALVEGTTDIAMLARPLRDHELTALRSKNISVREHVIGYDALVIVVHELNTVSELTSAQVRDIFTGSIRDWAEVGGSQGPISVLTRNNASGAYHDFQKLALHGEPYASQATKIIGSDHPSAALAKNPLAISYVGLAYSAAPNVKALKVDGRPPGARDYFLRRKLYLLVRHPAPEPVAALERWLSTSNEVPAIVRRLHFVPFESPDKALTAQ